MPETSQNQDSQQMPDAYDLPETTIQIQSTHPLYLHPHDHPGMTLVYDVLTDSIFLQRKISITIALSVKNKIGIINGTNKKPNSQSKYANAWERCNSMVISSILNSVSSEIRQSIVYFGTACEMWENLLTRYSQSDAPRIFHVRKSITLCTQGALSVNAYFTRFRGLWDELTSLMQIPKCVCDYTCGASRLQDEYEHVQKLTQFLMGLSDTTQM